MDLETSPVAFEDVAQELSGPLRRYLERLVGNRATADDLLQNTLLKIARGLPEFEGRSSVKTWAFTIATRVATDHYRRPQSRAQIVEIDEAGPNQVLDEEIDQRLVIDEMRLRWCSMTSRDRPPPRSPRSPGVPLPPPRSASTAPAAG